MSKICNAVTPRYNARAIYTAPCTCYNHLTTNQSNILKRTTAHKWLKTNASRRLSFLLPTELWITPSKKDMTFDFLKIVVTSSRFFFYKFVESLEESVFPTISHVDSTVLRLNVPLCQVF